MKEWQREYSRSFSETVVTMELTRSAQHPRSHGALRSAKDAFTWLIG